MNYNLLNILRPLKFLPWILFVLILYNIIFPTNFGWIERDIKQGTLQRKEWQARKPSGGYKTVVTHSFTYLTKNGKEKYVAPIMRFNWCADHTHDFNRVTYFKPSSYKDDRTKAQLKTLEALKQGKYVYKPAALDNGVLICYVLVILLLQAIITECLDDELDALFFPLPCREWDYIESRRLRFNLNARFLGYQETDIDKFIEKVAKDERHSFCDTSRFYSTHLTIAKFREFLATQA